MTKVRCDVETCNYNKSKQCCLDKLDISCIGDASSCNTKKETICKNFSKK